jgi:hypothetical protein
MSSPTATSSGPETLLQSTSQPEHTKPTLSLSISQAQTANTDDRRRGGTARTPGTRTPRRVQWAQAVDDEDEARARNRTKELDELHSLDEAGLDVRVCSTFLSVLSKDEKIFSQKPF